MENCFQRLQALCNFTVISHSTGMDQNTWDRPDPRARNTHRPMQMRKLSLYESDILPITIAQRAKRYEMLLLWKIRLRENKQIWDQLKTMKLSKLISYNQYLWNSLKSTPNLYSETSIQCLLMLVTFYWYHSTGLFSLHFFLSHSLMCLWLEELYRLTQAL